MSNFISLEKARKMHDTFKKMKDVVLKPEHKHALPFSEKFDRSQLDAILANSECKSIRIYYGMNDDNVLHSIIVGVNDKDENIYNLPTVMNTSGTSSNTATSTSDPATVSSDSSGIIEDGVTCPPVCPSGTGL